MNATFSPLAFYTPFALRLLRAKSQFKPSPARLFCMPYALVTCLEAAPLKLCIILFFVFRSSLVACVFHLQNYRRAIFPI